MASYDSDFDDSLDLILEDLKIISNEKIEKEFVNGDKVKDLRSAKFDIETDDTSSKIVLSRSKLRALALKYGRRMKLYKPGTVISVEYPEQKYTYKLKGVVGVWYQYPMFKPDYTPLEILRMGVYEGWFIRDCYGEIPREWYLELLDSDKIAPIRPLKKYNYYKVYPDPVAINWRKNDYGDDDEDDDSLLKKHDPRGFLQWYIRFYLGRRIPSVDRKQINRWLSFRRRYKRLCAKNPNRCSPRLKQAMLCWACSPE